MSIKFLNKISGYQTQAKGFNDLLNYAYMIEDGIIQNKDGSLMSIFEYQAPDAFSATSTERNSTARQMNNVLSKFGNGWMIQFDSLRVPHSDYFKQSDCHFPDAFTKLVDMERATLFAMSDNLYTTHYYVTLTYLPPIQSKSKLAELMYDNAGEVDASSLKSKQLLYFKNKLSEFTELAKIGLLEIKQLKQYTQMSIDGEVLYFDKALEFINMTIVGKKQPIQYPHLPRVFLDTLLSHDFATGANPRIAKNYTQMITIDGYPMNTYPNILGELDNFNIDYRWNTRFIYVDQYEAEQYLKKIQKKWKQKQLGIMQQIFPTGNQNVDLDATMKVAEIDAAIAETNSGVLANGFFTTTVIIYEEDLQRLENATRAIQQLIEANGFKARLEAVNATESYLGSLPGHSVQNLRRNMIGTMSLSHLIPLSTMWQGNKYNSCDKYPPSSPALIKTIAGSTPFYLNLHVADVGHTLIFGPTGSGKSVLLATLMAQSRKYYNSRVFSFDKGKSVYALCKAVDGAHYDIGGDNNDLSFAPFAKLQQSDTSWAEDYVKTLLELQKVVVMPHHKEMIHKAVGLHIANNSRSLTELVSYIQDSELRQALAHYTISGAMGHLLDAEDDSLSVSDFSVFEIEELMKLSIEDALPVLLYLFKKIEQSFDGRPTFLFLDEAWVLLGHPTFRDKLRGWLKELRKKNVAVIIATQSLSDAAKSGILDVLQESCPTKIFLPNPEAQNKGTDSQMNAYEYYKSFALNDKEIEIITNAVQKREYYYKSVLGTRLFNLYLGQFSLAILGVSTPPEIKEIDELINVHGSAWLSFWLESKNVHKSFIDALNK